MSIIRNVIFIYFFGELGLNRLFYEKQSKANSKKKVFILVLGVFIFLTAAYYMIPVSYEFVKGFYSYHVTEQFWLLFIGVSLLIGLVTGIIYAANIIFLGKDIEFLRHLPIPVVKIIIGKFTIIYILSLTASILVLTPFAILYMYIGNTFAESISFLLILFGYPIIPIIIGSILSIWIYVLIFNISAQSKIFSKSIFGLIGIIIIFYLALFERNHITMADGIWSEFLRRWNFSAFNPINTWSHLVIVSMSILVLVGFIATVSKWEEKVYLKIKYKKNKTTKINFQYKESTILKALYVKELRQFISSPARIMNSTAGIVAMCFLTMYIFRNEELFSDLNRSFVGVQGFIILAYSVLGAMSNMTPTSISLEGETIRIIKTFPIEPKQIFLSKILLSLSFAITALFINTAIVGCFLQFPMVYFSLGIFLPVFNAVVVSEFGILINLIFPRFEWLNDVSIIKRSKAAIIGTLGGIFYSLIPVYITLHFQDADMVILVFTLAVNIILSILLYFVIKKKGNDLYLRLYH